MSYTKYKQEREALENAYARRLLIEYGIQEVTTQRQAKNGTREFLFPVSTYANTNESRSIQTIILLTIPLYTKLFKKITT